VLDISINEKGTLMASSGSSNDVLIWTMDWKSSNCLKSYFDEEHENQIDTIAFAPYKAAVTLTKCLVMNKSGGE
jgi:WD40 repeat protein